MRRHDAPIYQRRHQVGLREERRNDVDAGDSDSCRNTAELRTVLAERRQSPGRGGVPRPPSRTCRRRRRNGALLCQTAELHLPSLLRSQYPGWPDHRRRKSYQCSGGLRRADCPNLSGRRHRRERDDEPDQHRIGRNVRPRFGGGGFRASSPQAPRLTRLKAGDRR